MLARKAQAFKAIVRGGLLALALLLLSGPSPAQDAAPAEEFAASATAIDAATILTGRYTVALWGIEAVSIEGTALLLQGRTALDDLISGGTVRCRIISWDGDRPVAQCVNHRDEELGLAMLKAGYAVVDRPAIAGTVFDVPYQDAEALARRASLGAWAEPGGDAVVSLFNGDTGLFYGWVLGTLVIPVLCFLFFGILMIGGFARINARLKEQMEQTQAQEERMRNREKFVMAAMLESELMGNKGKLEAFIIIYRDMLGSLRGPKGKLKYQQTGEIIHEAPSLNRSIFDGNTDKLELLGQSLAKDIVDLYSQIEDDPGYVTLDSSMPVDEVILRLQQIVSDAEKLLAPIDRILSALLVILRDKKSAATESAV